MSKSKNCYCDATPAFLLDTRHRTRRSRDHIIVLLGRIGCRVHGEPSKPGIAQFDAKYQPVRRLAGAFPGRARSFFDCPLARKQEMGADFLVDVDRIVDRRLGWARD